MNGWVAGSCPGRDAARRCLTEPWAVRRRHTLRADRAHLQQQRAISEELPGPGLSARDANRETAFALAEGALEDSPDTV